MHDEEESMELSGGERQLSAGESGLTSMLHNFSFDVSWNTWNKQPSPPRRRTMAILSPARLTPASPNPRSWSTPTAPHRTATPHPTVKVSQQSNLFQSNTRSSSLSHVTMVTDAHPISTNQLNMSQSEVNFPVAPKQYQRTARSEVSYPYNQPEMSSPRRHSEMNYKQFEMDLIRGGTEPYYDCVASPYARGRKEMEFMQFNDSFPNHDAQEKPMKKSGEFEHLKQDLSRRKSTPSRPSRDQYINDTGSEVISDYNMNESPKKVRNINNNEIDSINDSSVYKTVTAECDGENQNSGVRRRSRGKSSKKRNIEPDRVRKSCKEEPASPVGSSSRLVLCLVVLSAVAMGTYLYIQVDSCSVFNIDLDTLQRKLADNVFGQHIAVTSVISSLREFSTSVESGNNRNTLVLSFHGWTGIGKNYVSKFVAACFYNAKIFWYLVPLHFPHEYPDSQMADVQNWILGNVTTCGVNVFVFDEMDKATEGLLTGLMSAIETLQLGRVDEDGQKLKSPIAVFIFLSNSKASHINQYLFSQIQISKPRESLELSEFADIFASSSGEWFEEIQSRSLIDSFIPFLPLAETHVRQCVKRDLLQRGRDPTSSLIDRVMNELSFFDMGGDDGQMSLTGCKRVQDKVDLHVET